MEIGFVILTTFVLFSIFMLKIGGGSKPRGGLHPPVDDRKPLDLRHIRSPDRVPRAAAAPSRSTQERSISRSVVCGRCWVIDGDTIDIAGTRIRLYGIDAPELDHPYGKNAKWALVRLCQGSHIKAVFEPGLSHDRAVATCYLPDGRDLSAEMVRAGMAVDWPKFSGGKYRHLEPAGIRKKLWRCDARQKGRMPPSMPD